MNIKIARRPLLAGLIACTAAATIAPVSAQSTGSPFEPELTSIVMEAKIDLANIHSATALPDTLLGLLASGAVELRSRIDTYDPIARTARTTLFLSGPTQPIPTDATALPGPNDLTMVSQSTIRFETILHTLSSSVPVGTWTGVGHFVAALSGPATLQVAPGTPFTTSYYYPSDAISAAGDQAAQFGELSFVIPGSFNLYAKAAVGALTLTPPTASVPSSATANSRSARK